MSSGSNPATTTGVPCRATNGSKMPQPVIVAAWPAARNPSTRDSGISATISITGGMYLCADRTEKFRGGSARITAAVATAVVSNPVAKNTTSSVARARQLDGLRDAVDDVDSGAGRLGVAERSRRAGHAQHVAVGRDAHALQGKRHRLVDLRHVGDAHRAAGAHDHVETAREARTQPELRDRLLVAAADVHHRHRAADRRHGLRQRRRQIARPRGIAELEAVGSASAFAVLPLH